MLKIYSIILLVLAYVIVGLVWVSPPPFSWDKIVNFYTSERGLVTTTLFNLPTFVLLAITLLSRTAQHQRRMLIVNAVYALALFVLFLRYFTDWLPIAQLQNDPFALVVVTPIAGFWAVVAYLVLTGLSRWRARTTH